METSPVPNFLRVLNHRDVWRNNLMFKIDDKTKQPQHCILIDFQTVRYLPITIDVLMAIICTAKRETTIEHFEKFLLFYYDHLRFYTESVNIELESLMSFENFRLVCGYHRIVMLIYRCILLMITMIPASDFGNFSESEIYQFCEVDKSEIVLKVMKNDIDYEKRIVDSVSDVIECLFKNI